MQAMIPYYRKYLGDFLHQKWIENKTSQWEHATVEQSGIADGVRASTLTVQQTFSGLKRIKMYARNKTGRRGLAALASKATE